MAEGTVWEFRPRHGGGGLFGARADALAALDTYGCGDTYGPTTEHETLRCSSCSEDEDVEGPTDGAEDGARTPAGAGTRRTE